MLLILVIVFLAILACLIIYITVKKFGRTGLDSAPKSAGSVTKPGVSPSASAGPGRIYVEELECELSPEGVDLWKRLVTMKLRDKSGARNLVLFERKYKPKATMEELIQAAIDRWVEDLKLR